MCVFFCFILQPTNLARRMLVCLGMRSLGFQLGFFVFWDMPEWDGIGWDDRCIMLDLF